MRALTTTCIAAALALTANAAVIGKRTTSSPADECIGLVKNFGTKLNDLSASFDVFRKEKESTTTDAISTTQRNREKFLADGKIAIEALSSARSKCCEIVGDAGSEDDKAELSRQLSSYGNAVGNLLNSLVSNLYPVGEQSEPDSDIMSILSDLNIPGKSVLNCPGPKNPIDYIMKTPETASAVLDPLEKNAITFEVHGYPV